MLRATNGTVDRPSKVYMLWGTDFGKRSQAPDGPLYWITLVGAGYASHDNGSSGATSPFRR